jgi:NAD(P)-dependent dehydrogenase (short-subunit alcohol dehydrogenase family)
VLVADVAAEPAQRVASAIGGAALAHVVDVADPVACEAMVGAAVERFGRLDVAVNNAGIGGPQAPTGEYPLDGWEAVIAVNLSGVFHCLRAEIPSALPGPSPTSRPSTAWWA